MIHISIRDNEEDKPSLGKFCGNHWKGVFCVMVPLVLLPVPLLYPGDVSFWMLWKIFQRYKSNLNKTSLGVPLHVCDYDLLPLLDHRMYSLICDLINASICFTIIRDFGKF